LASDTLLSWFEKRRKSKILGLAQRQITLAMDTVNELDRSLKALSKGKKEEVQASIKRLFDEQVEIDELRRTVLEELTKGELPTKYREDLRGLVRRLDEMADYVKDSARSIKLLLETSLPKEIIDELIGMGEELRASTNSLQECIETLGTNPSMTKTLAQKVDFYEGKIDERYLQVKFLLTKYSKELDTAVLMFLKDLVEYIEGASDICVNTADYLRTLAASEVSAK